MKCKSCATAVDNCEVCGRPAQQRAAVSSGITIQLPGVSKPIPIALAKPTKPGTRRNPRQLKLSERNTVVTTIHFDAERLEQLNYVAMRAGVRLSHIVDQACREFIAKHKIVVPEQG